VSAPEDSWRSDEALPLDVRRYELQATWRDFATPLGVLSIEPGWRILDVGCGSGAVSRLIAGRHNPGAVVGLDLSPDFARAARRLSDAREVRRVHFVAGDARRLPFVDGAFDLVWSSFVLEYLASDPVAPLRELARVVRPGGIVAAFDVDGFLIRDDPIDPDLARRIDAWHAFARARGFDPEIGQHLPEHFRAAGLSDVQWRTFPDPELYPVGRPPEPILESWELRLAGMRGLADALGSEAEAERFRHDFLALLRRPDRRTSGANWLVWGRV
jgi:ubiquinone/menaquinone biosynthesis C-methylase UbiE